MVHGMQEVSGSSPLSSTGQKHNSNGSNSEYSSKVQQRRPGGPPYVCSIGHVPQAGAAGRTHRIQTLNWRLSAFHLRKSPCHRSRDSCHRVTTRPSPRPFLPATVAAFASSPAALAVLGVRSAASSQLPAGQSGAFADGRLGARARRIAPIVSVRRGACWCAAPLRRKVAPWRSPARWLARRLRHLRNPARRSARDVAGCQPSGDPVWALTLPIPGPGRRRWLDGGGVPLRGSRRAGASSRVQ